jgi:putative membrane protein insertion efficiency factor
MAVVIGTLRRATWIAGAPLRFALILLIRLYRVTLRGALGGQCRFHPSCSVYAEGVIRTHGAVRGVLMGAWRVLRCNPFGRGGMDEVPRRRSSSVYDAVIQRGGAA